MSASLDEVWKECRERIGEKLGVTSSLWLNSLRPDSIQNGVFCLITENKFTKEWVERRYLNMLRDTITSVYPSIKEVRVVLSTPKKKSKKPVFLDVNSLDEEQVSSELNPRFTFDTFVTGPSNRFAYAAARAVSESPTCYNPLLIYGGSGLGKTHLMHAIGHYTKSLYPDIKVTYIPMEKFVNEFIDSLKDRRTTQFQKKYRSTDMLLVDDIQFLGNKERTQEEFFHTFNELHNNNKQIVLTSDRPAKEIPNLQQRLISRFEWGLITDIQPPELETRIAILKKKADLDKKDVPDDVIQFIASSFESNIRELEGALIRVVAYSSLTGEKITLDMAREVLKGILPEEKPVEINIEDIIRVTAEYFRLSPEDLKGPNRSRTLVTARQVAMYLCRELTDASLPAISNAFGGRHHSTAIHSVEKIKNLMHAKKDIYDLVQNITNRLKRGG